MAPKKGEITADTIATWQTTGGKGGGKIVGGVNLPNRYAAWHNERYTPAVTPEEIAGHPAWVLKYPPKGAKAKRATKGGGKSKAAASYPGLSAEHWNALGQKDREEIANLVRERSAKQRARDEATRLLAGRSEEELAAIAAAVREAQKAAKGE